MIVNAKADPEAPLTTIQGATMAFLLCAMLERPHLHPAFSDRQHIKPFDFAIMCGGFLPTPRVPDLRAWYAVETPTLHVIVRPLLRLLDVVPETTTRL